jgi:hypothetical protein
MNGRNKRDVTVKFLIEYIFVATDSSRVPFLFHPTAQE